jgi:hypothetical protein
MNWHLFLEGIRRGNYTVLLMEATNILVLVSYIKKKSKSTIYLFLLSLVSLIQAFWAISGMLLFFSLITPFFLLLDYLRRLNWFLSKELYAINNIAYSMMFILFTITILSRKDTSLEKNFN